jgi:uncharacterized caspase-like protein
MRQKIWLSHPFGFLFIVCLLCAAPITHAQTPTTTPQTRGLRGEVTADKPATPAAPGPRRFYALVIGNNDYQALPKLKTAVGDAQAVANVLHDQFGFEPTLLLNATRQQIIAALNDYRRKLDENASLLIYYAGHGYNDSEVDKAYWLPVDSKLDDNANWISADDITTDTKAIHARHILIVSDSCYSGTITRDADPTINAPMERERYLQKMDEGKSRTLMASGGNEPVADNGGNGHSIFAAALLRGIGQMDKDTFTASEIFHDYIVESVAGSAEQTPEYSPLRNSGHENGDFIFVRANPSAQTQTATTQPSPTQPTGPSATQNGAQITPASSQTSSSNTDGRGLTLGQKPNTPAMSLPPNLTAEQYEDMASKAIDANHWLLTEAALRAALKLPGSRPIDHSNLAYALAHQQKYTEAEQEARLGLQMRPGLIITHARLAYVLMREEKFTEAEAERRIELRLGANAKSHSLLAYTLYKEGKFAEAEAEARIAVQMTPNDAHFHNHLAMTLREQKKLPEAIAEFREATRLAPNNTQFLIDLNQALNAQKRQ